MTTIDNDTLRLEAAAFQFKDDASSSGTLYLDAFTSWADSSLAHERKYYSAGGGPVAMRVDGVLFYLLGDHLGSTSLTTHANGQVHSEMKYKPYGEMRLVNGQSPTDIGYTGQRVVVGIGLHFYNARHYDSSLGRFVEADSLIPRPEETFSWDRYQYVESNPVRYRDPTGHDRDCVIGDYECKHQVESENLSIFFFNHKADVEFKLNGTTETKRQLLRDQAEEKAVISSANQTDNSPCNLTTSICDPINPGVDYRAFTFGTAIPSPLLTALSWEVTLTVDRYGQTYLGGGVNVGLSTFTGVNVSWVNGYVVNNDNAATPENLSAIIEEWSVSPAAVPIFYVGTNSLSAFEIGIGTPGVGVSLSKAFLISTEER